MFIKKYILLSQVLCMHIATKLIKNLFIQPSKIYFFLNIPYRHDKVLEKLTKVNARVLTSHLTVSPPLSHKCWGNKINSQE